jgi:hypothetical protein
MELIRAARWPATLFEITVTAGQDAAQVEGGPLTFRVPKKDLVGVLQALLQTRRLVVAAGLKDAPTLQKQLGNFRVKATAGTDETNVAFREGQHDDLVLAIALACWLGERFGPGGIVSRRPSPRPANPTALPDWVFGRR